MAQAGQHQHNASPIFRLDVPDKLDLDAIEATAAKPQRGAWRYLINIFESAHLRHCRQFSLEPDATLWRLRYHLLEGCEEHILSDPSLIIWAIDALQTALWDENYHTQCNRVIRFTWSKDHLNYIVTLRAVQTVNGDLLQFDLEPITPMPPTLDDIGLEHKQLLELRNRLQQRHGMLLITSSDPLLLDNTLSAINQALISPDQKLLSIQERHRYSLPRTMQIDLHNKKACEKEDTWQSALDTYHDVLLSSALVPEQFQERISDRCDQGTLTVQTMQFARAADAINLLNAGILRRAPQLRAVTSVLCHFPVAGICPHCATQSELNEDEHAWLEQLRTPATENVISWLSDGNAEQFMKGDGCEACADTGYGETLSVFNFLHRDSLNNQFPTPNATNVGKANQTFQRQLLALAKTGRIPLQEVIRVLRSS